MLSSSILNITDQHSQEHDNRHTWRHPNMLIPTDIQEHTHKNTIIANTHTPMHMCRQTDRQTDRHLREYLSSKCRHTTKRYKIKYLHLYLKSHTHTHTHRHTHTYKHASSIFLRPLSINILSTISISIAITIRHQRQKRNVLKEMAASTLDLYLRFFGL